METINGERLLALLTAKKEIAAVLREHEPLLNVIRENHCFGVNSLLHFSNNITQTIRAPVDWAPGLPLTGHPPAPLLEQMRVGAVDKYNSQFETRATKVPPSVLQLDSAAISNQDEIANEPQAEIIHPSKRLKVAEEPVDSKIAQLKESAIEEEAPKQMNTTQTEGNGRSVTTVPEPMDIAVTPLAAAAAPPALPPAAAPEPVFEAPVKARSINISFGFESDSESDSDS